MILCIDIGGTAVKMALMDEEGLLHDRHEASVSFDGYKTPILTTVLHEARALVGDRAIEGIGVSTTGLIDMEKGLVIGSNLPGYEGSAIKQTLEDAFRVPVWVLNDANAAALGECFAGGAKGRKHVIMLTLGTGVGGGIVLNGHAYQGVRGISGELGHFTLYQDGLPCPCGKRGCLEAYASTSALVRRVKAATGKDGVTGRTIFDGAQQGDETLLQELDSWIDDVAAGAAGLVHIFNPEMVLIGGGVSAQETLLMEPLRRKVFAQLMPAFAQGLQIERATLGNDAGLVGAGRYWMDRQHA